MGKLKRLLSRKKSSKADDQVTDVVHAHEAKNQELERFPENDPEQASPSLTIATITDDEQEEGEKPEHGAATTSANPDSDVSAKLSDSIDHDILLIKRNLNSDLEKEADVTAHHSATSITTTNRNRHQNKPQNTADSNEGTTLVVETAPWSTGHSSISAGIDRGVPFTVRPTGALKVMGTQQQQQQRRRFARSPTPPDELYSKSSGVEGHEEEGKGSTSKVGSNGTMNGEGEGRGNGVSIAAALDGNNNLEETSRLSAVAGGAIPPSPRQVSMAAAGQTVDTTQFVNAQVVETLLKELRLAAAMEMSVYRGHISSAKDADNGTKTKSSTKNGTHSNGNSNKIQQPFTSARRITRTIMALGWPGIEGIMFGAKVVQALDQVTTNYSESFSSLATWWGNVVCIRSWLWVLTDHDITHGHSNSNNAAEITTAIGGGGGGGGVGEEKGGVAPIATKNVEQLEAAIAVLERKIFDLLVDYMWTTTRQYATCIINYAPSSLPTSSSTSLHTVTMEEEGATHTWIAALTHTMALIKPALTGDPLFGILKGQLIKAVLGALDNAIVDSLLRPPLPAPSSAAESSSLGAKIKSARKHYNSNSNNNNNTQLLSENLLPYQRDRGNVATGVSIKVFSQTIETWLASLSLSSPPPQHSNHVLLLPLLASTANLLTMPKQALLDPEVRKEALPDLPPSLMYQLLSLPCGEEDEEEEEKVPSGLMKTLKEEIKQDKNGESNATSPSPPSPYYYYHRYQYQCMDEKSLLSEGYVSSVNLRLSPESDDELEEMATKFSGDGDGDGDGDLCHRFHLLKELWS